MSRLLLPNFAFEEELSGRPFRPTSETQHAAADLAPLLALLAEPGDAVLVQSEARPDEIPACLTHAVFASREDLCEGPQPEQLLPWGWSAEAARLAGQLSLSGQPHPSVQAVWEVNSRRFSAAFDLVCGDAAATMPFGERRFGRLCGSSSECHHSIERLSVCGYSRWVAKPQLSHAGRNRLIASGQELNPQQRGWLTKHLQSGGSVYLEPWVWIERECGLQFEIDPPGGGSSSRAIRFLGAAELLNDPVGRYQGSLIRSGSHQSDWDPAIEHGLQIGTAARQAGYFGPLGIDCMIFRDAAGKRGLRMSHDLNARFTMGRLALQLLPLLEPAESAVWWHWRRNSAEHLAAFDRISISSPPVQNVRMVPTSPNIIGRRPIRAASTLLVCSEPADLISLLELIRQRSTN